MGTGVGEAMLLESLMTGAAVGAGTSAITGGDPLKGALLGAVGGGIGSGLSGAITGAAETGAVAAGEQAASAFAPNVSNLVPTETGLYDPTSLKVFGSEQQFINQAAANQIGGMQNLAPNLKEQFIQNAMADPTRAVKEATIYNQLASNPFDQFKNISSGDALVRNKENKDIAQGIQSYIVNNPLKTAAIGGVGANMLLNTGQNQFEDRNKKYKGPLSRFRYSPDYYIPAYADGGITDIDMPPVANYKSPVSMMAKGGISDLGSYSDGGRMLKGPGDGMSDSIPARIGSKQPARLADGEFVIPADVVSHLGNGSTDAGAKQLYSMMDKVRRARTGTKKQGKEINPRKLMPA